MANEKISNPEVGLQFFEKVNNCLSHHSIKSRSDFVTKDQFWLGSERAGEIDSLLLATR